MKRVFDTEGQYLRDSYVDEEERHVQLVFPNASLEEYLRHGPSAPVTTPPPPEELSELLAQSAKGRAGVALRLLRYLDDARVRAALVDLCLRVDLVALKGVARAVGISGGAGAIPALKTRLSELAFRDEPFEKASFINDEASSLLSVGIALLKLDPESTAAAESLVRLFHHPTRLNRLFSLRVAAELMVPHRRTRTAAYELIRCGLRDTASTADPEAFVGCAPMLLEERDGQRETLERLRSILTSARIELRTRAVNSVLFFGGLSGIPLALDHLRVESSLHLRVWIAQCLGSLVAVDERISLIERGIAAESPSLRLALFPLMGSLPEKTLIASLARRAADDEPDIFLRDHFSELARRSDAAVP